MKQLSLLALLCAILSISKGQTVTTWQGPSTGGSWNNPANWDNGVPAAPTTEIVFDGSVSTLSGGLITINDVAAQTNPNFSYDKLTVINAATVNLSGPGQIYWYFNVSINIETGSRLNAGAATSTLFTIGGTLSTVINIDGVIEMQGQGNSSNATNFEPSNISFASSVVATIRGKVILSGKNSRFTPNASTPNFESGSELNITRDGGFVSKANYKNGSLIKIQGVVAAAPSFTNSATYEGVIEWDCPGQTIGGSSALILPSGSFSSFDSLVIKNTGNGKSVRLSTSPSGYYVKNIIIEGGILEFGSPGGSAVYTGRVDNITQNAGILIGNAPGVAGFDNAYEPDTISVSGNFIQNGGTFDFSNRTPVNASPNASFVLQVAGNVRIAGVVKLSSIAAAPGCALVFNGAGVQDFEVTNTGVFSNKIKTVINNSAVATGINAISNITLPDSLVFKKGYFFLNNFNLTNPLPVQPVLNPYATHVVTNGTGMFVQKNVGFAPVGIPIGASVATVNPLIIAFTSVAALDVGAKVEAGLNPAVAFPEKAVNRTWQIKPFGIAPSSLAVSFSYANLGPGLGDGNSLFSYSDNDEVGLYDGTNWQVISMPGGITPAGTNPYALSHVILNSLLAPNVATPLVIGNVTSVTPISKIINFTATKNGNSALLKWDVVESGSTTGNFDLMHSTDGRSFTSIGNVAILSGRSNYSFTHNNMVQGVNYYRVKLKEINGTVKYSVIEAVINRDKGIVITSMIPTMVNSTSTLTVTSAAKELAQLIVSDMQGKVVKKQLAVLMPGRNNIQLDCSILPAGVYQMVFYNQGTKINSYRFVKN